MEAFWGILIPFLGTSLGAACWSPGRPGRPRPAAHRPETRTRRDHPTTPGAGHPGGSDYCGAMATIFNRGFLLRALPALLALVLGLLVAPQQPAR